MRRPPARGAPAGGEAEAVEDGFERVRRPHRADVGDREAVVIGLGRGRECGVGLVRGFFGCVGLTGLAGFVGLLVERDTVRDPGEGRGLTAVGVVPADALERGDDVRCPTDDGPFQPSEQPDHRVPFGHARQPEG
jgi:hypothetical protein